MVQAVAATADHRDRTTGADVGQRPVERELGVGGVLVRRMFDDLDTAAARGLPSGVADRVEVADQHVGPQTGGERMVEPGVGGDQQRRGVEVRHQRRVQPVAADDHDGASSIGGCRV